MEDQNLNTDDQLYEPIVVNQMMASNLKTEDCHESVSIDLSNQRVGDSQLELMEDQAQKLFSKTATNEFIGMNDNDQFVIAAGIPPDKLTNMIDSQASSPTIKSDNNVLRTTAQFNQINNRDPNSRAMPQQFVSQQNQHVLAASGPGNHHLKSQSTAAANNNYIQSIQQSDYYTQPQPLSQGRTTETRGKKLHSQDPMGNHGLNYNQGNVVAKSAVLQTTGKGGNQGVTGGNGVPNSTNFREIKRIPSKMKAGEKGMKKRKDQAAATVNASNMPTEILEFQQQMMVKSQGGKRTNSQNNRLQQMMIGEQMMGQSTIHSGSINTSNYATPQVNHPANPPPFIGGGPPMPVGDQYQGFSFMPPMGSNPFQFTTPAQTSAIASGLTPQQQHQMYQQALMPQPQVHFIAKQQKFYGVSPERAPLIFKQNNQQEKRPYTSSGHVITKRAQKAQAQSSAIAALYLGQKPNNQGSGGGGHSAQSSAHQQPRNQSQPTVEDFNSNQVQQYHLAQVAYSMQAMPVRNGISGVGSTAKKPQHQGITSNSATIHRKDKNQVASGIHNPSKLPEQLQEQVLQLKQSANTFKEENVKLKTKIKILENEMGRKERAIEEFLQQNQFIQNAQKANSGTLAPIVQTAQRYQQETFLVMSLKKQVKELKTEIMKKEEELTLSKKNIKNTKFYEMEQEMKVYKDELIRLRYVLEQTISGGAPDQVQQQDMYLQSSRPSIMTPFNQSPFLSQQNYSQPQINNPMNGQTASVTQNFIKQATTSQTNFFPDTMSNLSQYPQGTTSQNIHSQHVNNQYTLSNDDQVSRKSDDTNPSYLPPLSVQQLQIQSQKNQVQVQDQNNANNLTSGGAATTLSMVDTRDNAFIEKLTIQLSEKDSQIRKLQVQVDDFAKQRLARLQNASQDAVDGKVKASSAGVKSELQKIKKQLKEKEKEVQKLKQENTTQVEHISSNAEEQEKKVKSLQSQVSTYMKKNQEIKNELKRKDEQNEQLQRDLAQQSDKQRQETDKSREEQSKKQNKLQAQIKELKKEIQEKSKENEKLNNQLTKTLQQANDKPEAQQKEEAQGTSKIPEQIVDEEEKKEEVAKEEKKQVTDKKPQRESVYPVEIETQVEGELGLVATVLGCRENRDRIELAYDLNEYVSKLDQPEEEEKKEGKKLLGLASDYKLILSDGLKKYIVDNSESTLARAMPKYDFISPNLALLIMSEVRKMMLDPELIEILNEKETETRLPFDALRDLCARFDRCFTDEHCAFITASYLTEIDEGIIYINFKELLVDLKDPRGRDLELSGNSKIRAASSLGSEGSDSDMRKMLRGGGQSLSEILSRSGGKGGPGRKVMDEEHMLDIAEAIFIKMADLMIEKGRSVRGVFTKYSTPEVFPDHTMLELLSPAGFLEGIKETGVEDLQEFEVACLMRVLAKPELENAVILSEFAMIMENFGVLDQMDEDNDDYISDTEASVAEDTTKPAADEATDAAPADTKTKTELSEADEDAKEEKKKEGEDEAARKEKGKRKARAHNLDNIDDKGVKILRKLARFLLKQFLHPREFFSKVIHKDHIRTKKREFNLEVMKFKDFYLRIKIANIRKRLTENQSLNDEICLDRKTHKDVINVKILVKALEEIAEVEQKTLLEEEKEAAEKLAAEKEDQKTIGESDVETPRSDAARSKNKDNEQEESKEVAAASKEEQKGPKESYSLDMMKFGNASIKTKGNTTSSPLNRDRQFAYLNTIEEERHETQTSNYQENASEREDSKVLSSNHIRQSSNTVPLEFDQDSKRQNSMPKLSPDLLNKTLSKEDKRSFASQLVSQSSGDIEQANPNVMLPQNVRTQNEGRLTGRSKSIKEDKLSKSLADASINNIKSNENVNEKSAPITPLTETGKVKEDLTATQQVASTERPNNEHAAGDEDSIEDQCK